MLEVHDAQYLALTDEPNLTTKEKTQWELFLKQSFMNNTKISRRRFVTETFCYRRSLLRICFYMETFCSGDMCIGIL
jgi:hypothetical protein